MQYVNRVSRFARWLPCIALLALAPARGVRAEDQGYGYVWADNPTAAFYRPSSSYAYNEAGTPPTVTRTGTGKYSVTFPGLSALSTTRGNVQVTAYGTTSHYCKVDSWTGDIVSVACFSGTGAAADTRYSVLYLMPDAYENHYAFALANQPVTASYTPVANRSYNPGGGAITAVRAATGQYAIHFGGFLGIGSGDGHVQVTAQGGGNARCRLEGWTDESAQVRCRNAAGAPIDSAYSILYWRPEAGETGLAFAWANQPTTASYSPFADRAYEASGGAITATRTSAGVYRMQWPRLAGVHGGNIQVTADGSYVGNATHCKAASWGPTGATIRCYDAVGNQVDSYYTVLFVRPPKKPWSQEYGFAFANQPTTLAYNAPPIYSYNPLGGAIEITRIGTGQYNVHFEHFEDFPGGGNVQVTAHDTTGRYCKVESWTDADVRVRCFDLARNLSDARFTVLFLKSSSATRAAAYAWVHDPVTVTYEPLPFWAHNPTGGTISVNHDYYLWGLWDLFWNGFDAIGLDRGMAHVTAYGLSSDRCGGTEWRLDQVGVECNDTDTPYSVLYLRPDADHDGLAFARALSVPSSYTLRPENSFNADDGPVTAERLGTGHYRVRFEGFARRGFGGGHVQVMAFDSDDDVSFHCAIDSWGPDRVDVRCFGWDALRDGDYAVLFIKPVAVPGP